MLISILVFPVIILDLTFDSRTDGVLLGHYVPWVRLDLLHAQGDTFVLPIDAQDLTFDQIANTQNSCGISDLARP